MWLKLLVFNGEMTCTADVRVFEVGVWRMSCIQALREWYLRDEWTMTLTPSWTTVPIEAGWKAQQTFVAVCALLGFGLLKRQHLPSQVNHAQSCPRMPRRLLSTASTAFWRLLKSFLALKWASSTNTRFQLKQTASFILVSIIQYLQ